MRKLYLKIKAKVLLFLLSRKILVEKLHFKLFEVERELKLMEDYKTEIHRYCEERGYNVNIVYNPYEIKTNLYIYKTREGTYPLKIEAEYDDLDSEENILEIVKDAVNKLRIKCERV